MICEDSLCRQLNTCKGDMPVSSVYCGNMHYATPQPQSKLKDMSTEKVEKLSVIVQGLLEQVRSLNSKPVPKTYSSEFIGRRSNANRNKNQ